MLRYSRGGLTITEVLVALSIAAALLAFVLSALQESRATARQVGCLNNQRQVALAVENFRSRNGFSPQIVSYPIEAETDLERVMHLGRVGCGPAGCQ